MAGLGAAFSDFQVPITQKADPKNFDPGIVLGAHFYVAKPLALSIVSMISPAIQYPTSDTAAKSTFMTDVHACLTFKGAGSFLREDFPVSPYLSVGIGVNTPNSKAGLYVPGIFGLMFRLNEKTGIQLQTSYKWSPDAYSYMTHSIGIVTAISKKAKKKPTKEPVPAKPTTSTKPQAYTTPVDSDGDGIPDIEDKCPDEQGYVHTEGCPLPSSYPQNPTSTAPGSNAAAQPGGTTFPGTGKRNIARNDSAFLERAKFYILFEPNSDQLTPESYLVLDQIAAMMVRYPEGKLHVSGHTDNTLEENPSLVLSVKRAYNVKHYLVYQRGITLARITADGYGYDIPLGDNKMPEGRKKNARVEFDLFNE